MGHKMYLKEVYKISGFSPGSTCESVNRLPHHHCCTNFLPPQCFVSTVFEKAAMHWVNTVSALKVLTPFWAF